MPSTREERESAATARCPACGEEIQVLDYRQACTEYGYATLNGLIQETTGSDDHDSESTSYSCPDCEESIELDDLTIVETREQRDRRVRESLANINTARARERIEITYNPNGTFTTRGARTETEPEPEVVLPEIHNLEANDETRWIRGRSGVPMRTAHCQQEKCGAKFVVSQTETAPECPNCGIQTETITNGHA